MTYLEGEEMEEPKSTKIQSIRPNLRPEMDRVRLSWDHIMVRSSDNQWEKLCRINDIHIQISLRD